MEPVPPSISDTSSSLRAAATAILGNAKSILASAGTADPTTVIHDFRVEMKRWRAWLRLVEPFIGNDARLLRREVTLLMRELSASRDGQAALDAFDDLVKTAAKAAAKEAAREAAKGAPADAMKAVPFDSTARDAIAGKLDSLRGAAESGALDDAMLMKLGEAVLRADAQVASWPLEAVAFADIAAGLARSYRSARRSRPADWGAASDEDLHELRKAVVTLRYQIEIVEELWPRMWKTFASELQRLRTQLGRANDLAVLTTMVQPRQELSRWRRHIAPRAAMRRMEHRRRAERIAARIFAESPRAFRKRLIALWQATQTP